MMKTLKAADEMALFLAKCIDTMSIDFGKADELLAHYRKVAFEETRG